MKDAQTFCGNIWTEVARKAVFLAVCLLPAPLQALQVVHCGCWQGNMRNGVASDPTRICANRAIRPVLPDTEAPAAHDAARGLTVQGPGLPQMGDAIVLTFTINRAAGRATVT